MPIAYRAQTAIGELRLVFVGGEWFCRWRDQTVCVASDLNKLLWLLRERRTGHREWDASVGGLSGTLAEWSEYVPGEKPAGCLRPRAVQINRPLDGGIGLRVGRAEPTQSKVGIVTIPPGRLAGPKAPRCEFSEVASKARTVVALSHAEILIR
jgi:hypothetical protein